VAHLVDDVAEIFGVTHLDEVGLHQRGEFARPGHRNWHVADGGELIKGLAPNKVPRTVELGCSPIARLKAAERDSGLLFIPNTFGRGAPPITASMSENRAEPDSSLPSGEVVDSLPPAGVVPEICGFAESLSLAEQGDHSQMSATEAFQPAVPPAVPAATSWWQFLW